MRLTDPLGELERSSHPLAEIGECLHLRGNWGVPTSKGEEREGEKGRKEMGREMRKEGEGEKGKDDLHPTLFLGLGNHKTLCICQLLCHNPQRTLDANELP